MAIGYGVAVPKPETRKRVKGRRKRQAAKVVKSVRARCVERDGACRICEWERNPDDTHEGDGGMDYLPYPDEFAANPSEWAHLNEGTRAKTRGMSAERRHTTAMSLMLCQFHHDRLDGRHHPRITITATEPRLGADGPLDIRTAS